MRVNYDEHQHAVYSAGRELNASRIELWTGIFSRWIDRSARPEIVDVGSGNGMYSELLADRFDARVTGAEPSVRMRELAEREHAHPGVRYVEGSAEVLPLADGSQDAALLSNVIQHFRDRDAAAREVARVLRPGGLVLVRGTMRESLARVPFFEYFPGALAIDERRMPSIADVIEMFSRAGLEHEATEAVEQESAAGLREYHARVRVRAISTLELLDDASFEAGVERMRLAAEAESEPRPVVERVDFLVLRKPAA